ncbi:GNAT family N-acetyltransferase [Deinococcus aetherius]|nr:GNAT family N-acetyltransferase [Deinococcus aetherius]
MTMDVSAAQVHDNPGKFRFELRVGGETGVAMYQRRGNVVVFTHTLVPETLEGQGVASKLIGTALDTVRAASQQVVPLCPFVAAYIRRHPEYRALVVPDYLYLVDGEN